MTEHALPTIVKHFGGGIKQLSAYDKELGVWTGNYREYPIRFRPEIEYNLDLSSASILHPIKNILSPEEVFQGKRINELVYIIILYCRRLS